MSDGKFVLYARKMLRNPLLARRQLQVEMIHPDMANVSRTAIKDKLAAMFKTKAEAITVFGCSTKFGGGRSTAFALIYDSADAKRKFDSKRSLLRDGVLEKPKVTRKQKKEIKGRQKKVRGKAKAAAAAAQGKKKK
jgi:small subunit ribosomal protein S24e